MNLSKNAKIIIESYLKGYRVIDGKVISNKNKILKIYVGSMGYYRFNVYYKGRCAYILVHRFVGYQKYGEKIFEEGIVCRHLDNNPLNNLNSNIVIGTQKQNQMDIPVEKRQNRARYARSFIKRRKDIKQNILIRKDRKNGMSYKELSTKHRLNQNQLNWILNRCGY